MNLCTWIVFFPFFSTIVSRFFSVQLFEGELRELSPTKARKCKCCNFYSNASLALLSTCNFLFLFFSCFLYSVPIGQRFASSSWSDMKSTVNTCDSYKILWFNCAPELLWTAEYSLESHTWFLESIHCHLYKNSYVYSEMLGRQELWIIWIKSTFLWCFKK